MAFLTMIAPLVALTYPIDKINDGQAQGFNKWLKEYLFNLLLQPLHLLLYTILVSSAYELASTNVIYALVAIGFLIPAEKLMRGFFGFEKASTPGSMAGAVAGASLLNSGLQKLLRKPPMRGKGGGRGGKDSDDQEESSPRIGGYKGADNYVTALEGENKDKSSGNLDAGGASAADAAAYNQEEDPVKRKEREALEEKIADGQLNEDELTTEQRTLLRMENKEQGQEQEEDKNIRQQGQQQEEDKNIRQQGQQQEEDKNIRQQGRQPEEDKNIRQQGQEQAEDKNVRQQGQEQAEDKNVRQQEQEQDGGENIRQQNNTQQGNDTQPTGRRKIYHKSKNNKTKLTPQEVRAGMGRSAKLTAEQAGRKIRSIAPKVIRGVAKGAVKGAAGVALGTTAAAIGATVGIATGDLSKAVSFTAGAAGAGAGLGSSIINLEESTRTKSATQIARERAYWGDKYDQHIAEENMKKWKKNSEKRTNLEKYLGYEKAKELYKTGKIDKYLQNEITNEKDIAALEKLQEKNDNINFNDALLVFDAYDKYGDIDRQKNKDKKDIIGGYAEKFEKSGVTKKAANDKANLITGMTTKLDGLKKDLQ